MTVFFKSRELYRVAVQMERNGLAFYMKLAEQASDISTKGVYQYLISAEKRHLRLFKRLLSKTQQASPPESYRGEYRKYLRALLKDSVFTSAAAARSRAVKSNPVTALKTGIQAEKDSILFYTELLNFISPAERPALKKILAEEKLHLRRLTDYKHNSGCFN